MCLFSLSIYVVDSFISLLPIYTHVWWCCVGAVAIANTVARPLLLLLLLWVVYIFVAL